MGLFSKRRDLEEPGGESSTGLHLDLEERRCPACRRDLAPWQDVCPQDGSRAVVRAELPPLLPPPPSHLLDEDDA